MDENQMTLSYTLEFESDAQTTGKFCYRFCTVIAQKIDSQSPAYSPSGFPSMSSARAISIDSLGSHEAQVAAATSTVHLARSRGSIVEDFEAVLSQFATVAV